MWWIVNIESPANPDYDGSHIDEEEIVPGRLAGIQLLRDIALGDEEEAGSITRNCASKVGVADKAMRRTAFDRH